MQVKARIDKFIFIQCFSPSPAGKTLTRTCFLISLIVNSRQGENGEDTRGGGGGKLLRNAGTYNFSILFNFSLFSLIHRGMETEYETA